MIYSKNEIIADINANMHNLDKLIEQALDEKNEPEKLRLLAEAAFWATYNVSGCFNSKVIEEELLNVAQQYSVELAEEPEPDSVLHVFTACWITGGHTQVARRWIENSPSNQKHSMVFIAQPNPVTDTPELLREAVKEKNGEMVYLEKSLSFVEKALKLRQIASRYEKIVLHVHMEDIVPILAFGTREFKRPIALFNHGDHLFSLGVSIADLVVNFRSSASNVSENLRKAHKSYVLPLPIDEPKLVDDNEFDTAKFKEDLGFSSSDKVIMTMASSYKYKPFDNYDFVKIIIQILSKEPAAVFMAIGPSESEKNWQKLAKKFPNRVKILGSIENDAVDKYLKIANLAIDSIPFSSFVALMDIAKYNVPCLSLRTPLNDLDCFEKAGIICETQEELVLKAVDIIRNNSESSLYCCLKEAHMGKSFQQYLNKLYESFPQGHDIHEVVQDKDRSITDLEIFVCKSQKASSDNPKKGLFAKLKSVFRAF